MVNVRNVKFSAKTQLWCVVVVAILAMVLEVAALNGPNVCMVKQKYNITKRVKYRAPMSVRTYEWCMAMPPRCSKWYTEMRDLTRLETEERTAEVAVCCPGYKMKDVACVPICPSGRTGHGCSEECPESKWGPNCVNDCQPCSDRGTCSSITGKCSCQEGWQGESCESRMTSTTSTTTTTTATVEELLTKKPATKPTPPITSTIPSTTTTAFIETTSFTISRTSATEITSSTSRATLLENITSPSTITFKETTLTPKTTLTTVTSSSKNSSSSESSLRSSVITLKEDVIVNTSPLTPPATSTLAIIEVATTKAPVTTTNILTTESTSTKPRTTEDSIQSTIEENKLSTGRKTYKEIVIEKADNKLTPSTTTEQYYPTTVNNNVTITTHGTAEPFKSILETTTRITSIHSRTAHPYEPGKYIEEVPVEIKTSPIKILKINELFSTVIPQKSTTSSASHESQMVTTVHATTTTEETTKAETTRRPDATIRYFPTTVKFKPKEIWIRPAQKGEAFTETKKSNHELHLRHRVASNKEPIPNTTPKTIIVSIIPTSVSYATFKKIVLTTASLLPQTTNMMLKPHSNFTEQGITKPMSVLTSTLSPTTSKSNSLHSTVENAANSSISKSVNSSKSNTHFYKVSKTLSVLSSAATTWKNKTISLNGTNSMTTVTQNLNSSNSVTPTISSTNFIKTTHKPSVTMGTSKSKDVTRHLERVTNKPFIKIVTTTPRNVTIKQVSEKRNDTTKIAKTVAKDIEKTNATKTKDNINAKTNKITTESPDYEETFHILTEPEHITAVMEGKGKERTSVDLISVISIAGGIMMAVITVAVIIVMIERCRRPRYEDVRKMNDIHMQVMIDNNDVPPPYVRSIFHTPLPDPPSSEKCHYQPISTLDRNLKQFMRPVVVKTISPIMLENFREILECHYDHLPRRSRDFEVKHTHCSIAPSIDDVDERTHLRPCSFTESTIDALKCEAKLDVLDSTTSEPLYAEIPCWRPPSEHAIEIMNLNGEAVTEL